MSKYRTLESVTEEYFRGHPEEIDAFIEESFAEYALDGDSNAELVTYTRY